MIFLIIWFALGLIAAALWAWHLKSWGGLEMEAAPMLVLLTVSGPIGLLAISSLPWR